MLRGKKILLGISGSIAAYKSILIVRLLVVAGAEIKVILTPAAKDFVSVLTLSTLSKHKVLVELADEETWANHVMLGRWADVMLIAPLTCNTLAKMVTGACDNLLLAAYLSATCPVVVAPAMDEDMWLHPSTKNSIKQLELFGNKVISVSKGALASGLFGEGRMAEPEDIITFLEENYFRSNELGGKKAIVTAGPTLEAIDPVRFISNHSSGKMGFAIAESLYKRGADVVLICGPVAIKTRYGGIKLMKVSSAEEMYKAAIGEFKDTDIAIMAAAVADYAPTQIATNKIKKVTAEFEIKLSKTKDILFSLGAIKNEDQLLIGFALETNNEEENAQKKLKEKNADAIVLNSLQDEQAGFGKETNKIKIFNKNGYSVSYKAKDKKLVANDIVDYIKQMIDDKV